MTRTVSVRPATPQDQTGVLGVLDAAMLETDAEQIRDRIGQGDVFVAVRDSGGAETPRETAGESVTGSETVLGALVLVDPGRGATAANVGHVDAVAVRRRQRGQGLGGALVRAACEGYGRLTAEFDDGVRPFYESLGFAVEPVEADGSERFRGELSCEE